MARPPQTPAAIPVMIGNPLRMAFLDANDRGNAERFFRLAQGQVLWVADLAAKGSWVAFDGRRWSAREGERRARQIAHDVARHIDQEATALAQIARDAAALKAEFGWDMPIDFAIDRVTALRKHAVKSGNAAQTAAMLVQARDIEALNALAEDFDTDPLAYNVRNGTIRFIEGRDGRWRVNFRAHEPEDRLMQLAEVDYDPKAECPAWHAQLDLCQPDDEQRGVLQLVYGMTVTGLTSDQSFYVHQGLGGDGKSTIHKLLGNLHGDYFRRASVKSFLEGPAKGGSEHRSDLTRLSGDIRMVVCEEPKHNSVWDGETIKQVTGDDIVARGAHATTEITYSPHWKLFVQCNILPRAPSDDDGFRRRLKVFLWQVQLHKRPGVVKPMEMVIAALSAEKSGILNWLIEGALAWLHDRVIPETRLGREALGNYWDSASQVGPWIDECCDLSDRSALEPAKGLYSHFKNWCEARGIDKPLSSTSFGSQLSNRHIMWIKDGKGNRQRRGIRLKPEAFWDAPVMVGAGHAAPAPPSWEDDADVPL